MIYPRHHLLPYQLSYLPHHLILNHHLRLPSHSMLAIIVWPSPRWARFLPRSNTPLSVPCRALSKIPPWGPFPLLRFRNLRGLRSFGVTQTLQAPMLLRFPSCFIPPMNRTTLLLSVRSAPATYPYPRMPSSSLQAHRLAFRFARPH